MIPRRKQSELITGQAPANPLAGNIRRDNDTVKDFSVTLKDIDSAIKYYFDKVIRPHVIENNESIPVPVIYGSPEKWKSVQVDGYYRDKNGKIEIPLIMFQRSGITKNRQLTTKIDAGMPQLQTVAAQQYTVNNPFSTFDIMMGRTPKTNKQDTFFVVVPDYVDITYNIKMWTNHVNQMNGLEESIMYAENSYWGEEEKFQFRSVIDNLDSAIEVEIQKDRSVRSEMTLTIHGYIIPATINSELSRQYSKLPSLTEVKTNKKL